MRETLPPNARGSDAIFGAGAPLDSLGLVNFLADLEARVAEETGCEIVLASERAFSRGRSPFRDVPSLVEFLGELLAEADRPADNLSS